MTVQTRSMKKTLGEKPKKSSKKLKSDSKDSSSSGESKNELIPKKEEKPEASLLTLEELKQLNLSVNSLDPTGKYKIVIRATEIEFIHVAIYTEQLRGKFLLAPPGYYWKFFSEKCYYTFDWYELEPIPQ
jgi:hypothetical protein